MTRHTLEITLDLPDDIMSLDEVRAMAKAAGVSFDDWVSRCLVTGARMEALHLADPETRARFAAYTEGNPIRLDPNSAELSRHRKPAED